MRHGSPSPPDPKVNPVVVGGDRHPRDDPLIISDEWARSRPTRNYATRPVKYTQ